MREGAPRASADAGLSWQLQSLDLLMEGEERRAVCPESGEWVDEEGGPLRFFCGEVDVRDDRWLWHCSNCTMCC